MRFAFTIASYLPYNALLYVRARIIFGAFKRVSSVTSVVAEAVVAEAVEAETAALNQDKSILMLP